MPLRNLIIVGLAAVISLVSYHKSRHSRYAAVLADAMGLIVDRYVEPIDRRDLFEGAMEGMVRRLDQYSGYISPEALQELQETILDQQFGGVGIEVLLDPETEQLTVLSPLFGTPAFKAGIQAGDVILEIDGHSTEGITIDEAVHLMRGEPGAEVQLGVLSLGDETPKQITVARAVISVESVLGDVRGPDGRWRFYLEDHPRIGYIRLATFGDKTEEELRAALSSFEDHPIDGLILDIRGNAGGLLEVAAAVSDLFLEKGQIVTTRDRNGRIERLFSADPKSTMFRLPMVVLVDRYSASSSEILAACLQDHQRAKIIGERTWGKGTVQNVIFFEGGRSAIKLTTLTYWRPSRKNIHRGSKAKEDDDWGVRPDEGYEVPLTDEEYVTLVSARRQRHLNRARSQNSTDQGPSGEATAPSGASQEPETTRTKPKEDFEDPFLGKAIQFLQEQAAPSASGGVSWSNV